jgi:hypothetical protein
VALTPAPVRRPISLVLLTSAFLVAGCTPTTPSPPPSASRAADPSSADPSGTPVASPSPSAAAIVVPEPGRPFLAADVLSAMRESRRPGGVPDELETDDVAALVAEELWTFDGEAWQQLVIGGVCGPASCSLEVAGAPADAVGEDLYVFKIDTGGPTLSVEETSLRGLPEPLTIRLDEVVREAHPELFEAGALILTTARWSSGSATAQAARRVLPG